MVKALNISGKFSDDEKETMVEAFNNMLVEGSFGTEFTDKLQIVSVDEIDDPEDIFAKKKVARVVFEFEVEHCECFS